MGAGAVGAAATHPGTRGRRRIRQRGHLCGGARAAGASRLLHQLASDHLDDRSAAFPAGHTRLSFDVRRRRIQGLGLAHPVSDLDIPARRFDLHTPQTRRVTGLSKNEVGWSHVKNADQGNFRFLGQYQGRGGVLFGITSGMTVIWYGAQFYALFFMQNTLQVDYKTSYAIIAIGLALGTPLIVLAGALSDRIGRRPVMIAGMLLGAVTFFPSFHALANFANPGLADFSARNPIQISAANCTFSLFAAPTSACDKARKFFSRNGLSYTSIPAATGDDAR